MARKLAGVVFGIAAALTAQEALAHLPRAGIYLAGSVARALAGHDRAALLAGFLHEPLFRDIPESIPLAVIDDQGAALAGCAHLLAARISC